MGNPELLSDKSPAAGLLWGILIILYFLWILHYSASDMLRLSKQPYPDGCNTGFGNGYFPACIYGLCFFRDAVRVLKGVMGMDVTVGQYGHLPIRRKSPSDRLQTDVSILPAFRLAIVMVAQPSLWEADTERDGMLSSRPSLSR